MKVQVKRVPMVRWTDSVKALGKHAEFVEVPATSPGIKFKGVYTDHTRREVLVAWPVDRTKEAQETFAKEVCLGGSPVEEIDREVVRGCLSLAKVEHDKLDS